MDRHYPKILNVKSIEDFILLMLFFIIMFFILTIQVDFEEGDKLGTTFIDIIKHFIKYINK